MRPFSILICALFLLNTTAWETDLDVAKQEAARDHKYILLNFSGSDWCVPCIRLHKEIFDSPAFTSFAEKNLILVNADFPRLKKNQLPKEQQAKNDKMADQYNAQGNFPMTVLLDEQGRQVRTWEGLPNMSAAQFVDQLSNLVPVHH